MNIKKIPNTSGERIKIVLKYGLDPSKITESRSTIEQLFEDTDYKLDDVRQKKLVKPVALTLLPAEIKMIENTKKRKEFFIQIVLPLILKENNNIRLDRKTLFNIINKSNNTKIEKKWLKNKFPDAYVATSGKVQLPKSPFSFREKKKIINSYGITNIVQVKNPYQAIGNEHLYFTQLV